MRRCEETNGVVVSHSHLQKYFQSVQRRCAGARDGAGDAAGGQMTPPLARLHLAGREVVGHVHVLPDVQVLRTETQECDHSVDDGNGT